MLHFRVSFIYTSYTAGEHQPTINHTTNHTTMKKSERKLNSKQVDILKLAYTFRYLTSDNLAKLRGISQNASYHALNKLVERGYLGRKHHKSYRLQNKSARYFLTPKAIILLKDQAQGLSVDVLQTRRYEHKKSSGFIDHQAAICSAYNKLRESLKDSCEIYTQTHMLQQDSDNYPKAKPSLEVLDAEDGKRVIIELIPKDQHLFIAKKRIRQYIQHYDDNDWVWEKYPEVLFIARTKSEAKQLNAYTEEKMEDAYLDEDDFVMTAKTELQPSPPSSN